MLNIKYKIKEHQQSVDETPEFPVLPGKMMRGELEGLLLDISQFIGMSDSLLKSLLAMMRETRPSDWTDPTKEPTCFAMQSNIAIMLGKTARSVRRDEVELERRFAFLSKNVAGNGSRCRLTFADGVEFTQGLSFSPLIEKVPDLLILRDQLRYERQHSSRLKRKCSALRRNVKKVLMQFQAEHPENEDLRNLSEQFLSWPTRFSVFNSLESLEEHYIEVLAASELADQLLQLFQKMSGQADTNVLLYIQDTTKEPSVNCNASINKRSGIKPDSNSNPRSSAKAEASEGLENKCEASELERNSKFMDRMTPQRLFSLSSEGMQIYITQHQGVRAAPSAMDFILASVDRLGELGINKSAYYDAVDQMGDMATALCILIIDRNQFHPETPIHNPGGVLRAMTKRHRAGVLNIIGSLIGLSERSKEL